jgi:cytochrome c
MRRVLFNQTSTKVIKKESFMKKSAYFIFCLSMLGLVMLPVFTNAGVTGTPTPNNVKVTDTAIKDMRTYNCLACHAIDKKLVGPSFKDVAAKYNPENTTPDAMRVKILAKKVMEGGKGVWGPIPMPPNSVNRNQAEAMVHYILTLNRK